MIFACEYDSPVGRITLTATEDALVGLWIEGQRHFGGGLEWQTGENAVLVLAKDWLRLYFDGQRPDPAQLPLAPRGSAFRQAVWSILREIPYGETVTYGDINRRLKEQGIGSCAQAVGGAVGRNPISIIIPCHRVIGSDGSLTGYDGGVEKKRFLLELESGM